MESHSTVINSIVGTGTSYSGNIESVDLLRIDGNFSGYAYSQDTILVGVGGRVKGKISAPRIIIAGVFNGEIFNSQLVMVQSSAVVMGTINVNDIIVDSGALISASVKISSPDSIYIHDGSNEQNGVVGTTLAPVARTVGKISHRMLEKMFEL